MCFLCLKILIVGSKVSLQKIPKNVKRALCSLQTMKLVHRVFQLSRSSSFICLNQTSQDKDIYLLDDPLAAVDSDVAEHLMQKCIMELLRGKTRILCTHRIEFVDKADMVILMDNGAIINTGRTNV